ncbi:Multidrug transporter MdfA [Fundidesulfovibrio magnetotacticus]|uniref:Multidrug transporter MdfA n=1 Tax=Fundidesulfovibrio magnetotacticus TaxID=2730080 RepID=A0A6V8LTU8_9BACT|nr:MFS transporter [Fundidesulfovibrio magnetotacticus]GFK95892.1 Multidrug transporter MdfA [Fundidesulfovibrio magnetotacticus]
MDAFKNLCAVGFLARFSYALARNPVLPLFALFLGAGPEAIGLAVGISTVTGIFFKLPAGALSDVIGRRRTLLAGLVVFGVMPLAYFLIDSYRALLIVRFLHGLATAVYGPVAMAVVADVAGQRRGEMLSWFSSVGIIGTLLGAPIGGLVLDAGHAGGPVLWQFRLVFALSAVTGLAALLLGLRTLGLRDHVEPGLGLAERFRRFGGGIREVLSDRRIVAASAMEGVQNMTMGALEAFLPVYAITVAGLSEFQAGLLWGSQIVVTMLSKPLMGRFSDARGRRPLIVSGLVLCAVSFAAVPFQSGFWGLLAACLVFGLGEALVTSSSAALVADLCRARHFGSAMGAFGTIFDVGHASGPILAGLLVGSLGFTASFPLLAAPLLAAIPVFLKAVPKEDSHAS